ncbi:MAG: peroxiredoxin family protein [Planctomycetota bacterium]
MIRTFHRSCFKLAALGVFISSASLLHSIEPEGEEQEDVLAGHSSHGEAFNEGPRQAAYLMPGMGNVVFKATTESELAQKFINQGVAQLHGFWYYEAERSFRQAAVHDPDCAIAYWGMAMANTRNSERTKEFIAEAVENIEGVSKREEMFIRAYEKFCKEEDDKGKKIERKDRAQRYTSDLEMIVEEYPEDIEARAFLALQLWQNSRAGLPIVSYVAINSVIGDVFDENPMHPAHHYRIHLWDRHRAKRALESAANCGPSLPGVAHMWHMPGHIYDKLHRYHDAVWQQEASARVDHAHMMRDRVLPDQIHNFAHNNEWLIRNLIKIGRVNDALSLAKNMLELPRHPAYNSLEKRGSSKYGRERLVLVLSSYRLWSEALELSNTMYLEPTEDERMQAERQKLIGMAMAFTGDQEGAEEICDELKSQVEQNKNELKELEEQKKADEKKAKEKDSAGDSKKAAANRERRKKDRETRTKKLKGINPQFEKASKAIDVALAAASEDWKEALAGWRSAGLNDKLLQAEWMFAAGKEEDALKQIDKEIKDKPGQILPLASKVWLLHQQEKTEEAKETLEKLSELASQAELETPLLARITPIAVELGFEEDWAKEYELADDLGDRPDLDQLGPFRWNPYLAPDLWAETVDGKQLKLKDLKGRPTLVIFYLGFGCLHCVEQLHEFSPRANEFREQGIDVIAISTEKMESLKEALTDYSKPLDIPLHADPELKAFKAYRCYDDFEKQPLHGTFLIDPDGRVLWQDISYEPFMDVDFALKESRRLLQLGGHGDSSQGGAEEKLAKD